MLHESCCCTTLSKKDLSKAEYKTDQNDINQVIVWDRIIKRGEKTKLNLKRKVKNSDSNLNLKKKHFCDSSFEIVKIHNLMYVSSR